MSKLCSAKSVALWMAASRVLSNFHRHGIIAGCLCWRIVDIQFTMLKWRRCFVWDGTRLCSWCRLMSKYLPRFVLIIPGACCNAWR